MRIPTSSPLASFCRLLLANTIRLKNKPARALVLFGLIALATTVLASTVSSEGSLRQLILGLGLSNAEGSVLQPLQPEAALANPLLTAAMPQSSTNLNSERRGHTATLLGDGRVLIAGGENSGGLVGQSEIFDPAAGTFSVAGNLSSPRADHSATKLADGRVLIAGGRGAAGALNTTEIFDPTTGAFASGPAISVARAGHSATFFADGRILIAGGDAGGSAEIIDASLNSSNAAGSLDVARSMHSAALMQDGRVLIVGGRDAGGGELSSAEIFDTPASSFSAVAGSLQVGRVRAHLRVLFDGKVQIIGGSNDGSMEIYDPLVETIGAYAHVVPETDPCVGLPGYVLASQTRAALFHNGQTDPLYDRTGQTITELPGTNQALVAGGVNSSGTVLNSFSVLASSPATITADKMDYAPGETATITGRGFQPGEIVRLKIHEDPHTPQERGFDAIADADGNLSGAYLVQDYDLDMRFVAGARGLTSGWTAQTTFSDAEVFQGWRNISNLWNSSNLSSGNSTYSEGDTIPFRFNDTGQIAGSVHTVVLKFDFSNGGSGRFTDFLTSYNHSVSTVSDCASLSCTNNVNASTWTIPTDPSLPVGVQIPGSVKTYNISNVTFSATPYGSLSGGQEKTLTMTYTVATGAGPTRNPVIIFGGHLARENEWGLNNGASHFPGASTKVSASLDGGPDKAISINPNAITLESDLAITKTGSPDPVVAGTNLTYTLNVTNNGPNQAQSVTVTDNLPSSLTYLSCVATNGGTCGGSANNRTVTYPTLNAGATSTITIVATVSSSATGPISNTASVAATSPTDPVSGNNSAVTTNSVTPACTAPSVTTEPTSQAVTYGAASASFTAAASGNPTPTVKWQVSTGGPFTDLANVAPYSGVTTGTLLITSPTVSLSTNQYRAVFTNTCGGTQVVNSNAATLTVNKAVLTVTADNASREYGAANPTFTAQYSGFVNGETLGTSGVTGSPSLTTSATPTSSVAGSPYTITAALGTLAASNYSFSFGNGQLTITKATLNVDADDAAREYGDANPTFAATYTGFKNSETLATSGVTGTPSLTTTATATSSVADSPYTITAALGTLASGNYSFTFSNGSLTITKATLTVTADNASRQYGDANPTFTAGYSGFKNGEVLGTSGVTGSPSLTTTATAASSVAGSPYAITAALGTLASGNYQFSFVNGQLTITARPITVTADPKTKSYGDADPALTYQVTSGSVFGSDAFTGGLTRAAGESVAGSPYAISQGTLALDSNYNLSYVSADLSITPATLTVTANAQTKEYGEADPTLSYSSSGFKFTDTAATVLTGALTRAAGETVASSPYAISLGSLVATSDYTISFTGANLTITARPVTITADAQSKTYGDADPALTYQITSGTLAFSDAFTGSLTRDAGEAVGSYAITQGTVALSSNYNLSYVGANLSITARPVTVTADAAQTKVYGNADPASFTYSITSGSLAFSDAFAGALSRDAGENVGSYAINQGTLTLSGNYILTYVGASFAITKAPLTITAVTNTKTYDANATAAATPTISGLKFSDTVTGLTEVYDNKNAGTGKTLSVSAYTVNDGNGGNNYTVSLVTNTSGVINQALLTITAVTNTKTYDGNTSAAAVPTVSGLQGSDTVTDRAEVYDTQHVGTGKTLSVSAYTVNDGNSGNNYTVNTVNDTTGVINKASLTITAVTNTKTYDGNTSASATPTVSGLQASDTVTGKLEEYDNKNAGTGKTLSVSAYTVNDGNGGNNYNVATVANTTGVINKRMITVTAVTSNKIYDGNTSSSGIPAVTPVGSIASGDAANFTQTFDTPLVGTGKTLTPAGSVSDGNGGNNYQVTFVNVTTGVITTVCSAFNGFLPPIGGFVENGTGGSFANPVRSFKLNSTIPVKFNAICSGVPLTTGIHTLQAIKYSNATTSDAPIDASPTDAATTGNQFRLTGTDWHYNLNTKGLGSSGQGIWLFRATLFDGSMYSVWIEIKK